MVTLFEIQIKFGSKTRNGRGNDGKVGLPTAPDGGEPGLQIFPKPGGGLEKAVGVRINRSDRAARAH